MLIVKSIYVYTQSERLQNQVYIEIAYEAIYAQFLLDKLNCNGNTVKIYSKKKTNFQKKFNIRNNVFNFHSVIFSLFVFG